MCFAGLNEESLISCKVQTIKADKIHSAFSIDAILIKILPLSTSCRNPSFPPILAHLKMGCQAITFNFTIHFLCKQLLTTTNTGLLQFSTVQTSVIIPINTRQYGSSSENVAPHANALYSEPISCGPAVKVGAGRRQAKEIPQCLKRSTSKSTRKF